jgi:hypothetical protein
VFDDFQNDFALLAGDPPGVIEQQDALTEQPAQAQPIQVNRRAEQCPAHPRLITRRPAPSNRRSTLLELTDTGRAVLDELVALRIRAFGAVADQMSNQDRAALLQGAHAFTAAQQRLSDNSTKLRAESRRASDKP